MASSVTTHGSVSHTTSDGDDHDPTGTPVTAFPTSEGRWRYLDPVFLVVVLGAGVVLRSWTRSPMWLDEALTLEIARQPIGSIPAALRMDGHPPLYYVLLHLWMSVFGESDRAVRALPALFGTLAIPATAAVAWRVAGRSAAWCTAVVVAVMPYMVRYGTENRMYSLIMLLVPLAWLCADSALRRPRPLALVGLALCTSALLWAQYWALWAGAAAALVLVGKTVHDRRGSRTREVRADLAVLGALAVGALSFVPWIPTMLHQQAHTGTPWATRAQPPTVVLTTVEWLGGGVNAADDLAGWFFAALILLGAFGVGVGSGRIELDLRTRPVVRPLLAVVVLTIVIGIGISTVSNAAFQPRYNAVWLPLAVVVAGVGLATLRGPLVQRGALVAVVAASVVGCHQNVTLPRTQAAEAARVIASESAPGDVVMVCPDQLGPALHRVLHADVDVGSYPRFGDPARVDWTDYQARADAVPPDEVAEELLRRAGSDHAIFVVWSDRYRTHKHSCTDLVVRLGAARPDNRQILKADPAFFENEHVTVFRPGPVR